MNQPIRTLFIKPSISITEENKLDPIRVGKNKKKGIETSLILDTNILIHMEKVIKEGAKVSLLKKYGLENLVNLIKRCPPESICLSPGFALNEMPPTVANKSRLMFEQFCNVYLPHFIDAPNSIDVSFSKDKTSHNFFDLETKVQGSFAISFISFMHLQLIYKMKNLSPIEKFREYLNRLIRDTDILSSKEIEIAKYCFADFSDNPKEIVDIRKVF